MEEKREEMQIWNVTIGNCYLMFTVRAKDYIEAGERILALASLITPKSERFVSRVMVERTIEIKEGPGMEESQMKEKEVVATSGTVAEIFAAQIKSHVIYNVYWVQPVLIKAIGESPIEVGDQVEAVNVAESFLYPGNAEIGLYVLVYVSQGRFVFWALGS